jgi:hypothetical protein
MTFSEELDSCLSAWKNPSRTCGCKWDVLNVRKGNHKEGAVGTGGVCQQKVCFCSSGALKTYSNLWEGEKEIPRQ